MDETGSHGWWQASDGQWYRSAAPPRPGWWIAADGIWYPPQGPLPSEALHHQYPVGPQTHGHIAGWASTPLSNGAAKAGGVVGIVGAVLSLIPLLGIIVGLTMGIVAIVFSSIGLSRSSQYPDGTGMATAGLVLGILTVVFKLIPGIDVL